MVKQFEKVFHEKNTNLKFKFRRLANIEDVDEQQESLHACRDQLINYMVDESTGLKQMGTTARSSSTRAYAGHSAELRHIFEIKNMNLTYFARSFGLYKQVYMKQPPKQQTKQATDDQNLPVKTTEFKDSDLDEVVAQN